MIVVSKFRWQVRFAEAQLAFLVMGWAKTRPKEVEAKEMVTACRDGYKSRPPTSRLK